ncbi:glycosyltransferase family 4 protein [Pseudarthrobacter sp. NamB4]|nr:glycosyltransferase family 4 protein [Pseudarthrobacter sp. NamB4]
MALHHYTEALMQQLADAGISVELFSIVEPSQSGKGRLKWLTDYSALLYSAGRRTRKQDSPGKVLVTWPVLGFLDLLLVKLFCGNSGVIVYHDPRPLVRSVGSSGAIAALIRLLRQRPGTLVHSMDAGRAMDAVGLSEDLAVVPHPMLRPADSGYEPARTRRDGARPRVRVLGQYKADRDLDLLKLLAGRLGPTYDLDIVGRGWPAIPGWKVDARFVPEDELDELIATSDAIVIPYKRFYQSGIAIRALEQAVPVVGRVQTSLSDLYGPESRLLVAAGDESPIVEVEAWASAIEYALGEGRAETIQAARQFHTESSKSWASLGRMLLSKE